MSHDLAVIFGREEHESDCISDSEVSVWSDPSRERLTSDDHICDFYNVLWVEEKDSVSYRRACGWVPKHIWDASAIISGVVLG